MRTAKKNVRLCFFSIVRHASKQRRKPATRGMASQHLWTFERSEGSWKGPRRVPPRWFNDVLYVLLALVERETQDKKIGKYVT